jgi:TrmH family RNA methyltransferase
LREISSVDNPHFRSLLKLHQSSRERRKAGLSLLDGVHLVAAYLERLGAPQSIVVNRSALENPEIASLLRAPGMPEAVVLSDGLFAQLSSTATPTGIIAAVPTPRASESPGRAEACVLLEDIQDPGNMGSILRSTAAAGVREVYLSRGCVQAWSPRVLRAGMGAHFALRIYEDVDVEALARSYDGKVIAAVADAAAPYYAADLTGRVALAFGNEGAGLTPELRAAAHASVSIPMPGKLESLNVAAAAAVCLFERVRQESLKSVNR